MSSKNEMSIDLELFRKLVARRNESARAYYNRIRRLALDAFELRQRQRQELSAQEEQRLRNLEKYLSDHGMLGLVPS